MCIGVPVQVIAVDGIAADCRTAEGSPRRIDLSLVPEARPGDWLLAFLDRADRLIDAASAAQIARAHAALAAIMAGAAPPPNAFSDLDRPPELPPHLAAARAAGCPIA